MPSGDSAAVLDTAANIGALTTAQIASLASSLHASEVTASDASLALSAAQAVAFESAHIRLLAPIGDTVGMSDTAAHLQALTVAQIAALPSAGITQLVSTNGAGKFSVAQTAALETAGVTVSAPGAVVTLSDTAANLATLTAGQIAELPALGFAGVTSTNASVALDVAQTLAFEAIDFKVTVAGGGKVTISDAAANIAALTTAQIAGLPAVGVSGLTATGAGVTLNAAQALALEAAGITLVVPSGDSAAVADTATDIAKLTPSEIAGLPALHVTQIETTDTGVTLDLAQALGLETAKVALTMPSGDGASVLDMAANIDALTTAQITSLASLLHVSDVEASDTSLALTTAQAVVFENAHILLSAPIGDTVGLSDTAAHLQALTAAQIAALPSIGVGDLNSANANVSYSSAQTAAILSSGLKVTAAGTDTVTENFANGDYSVYQTGDLIKQKSVNTDGSYDIAYFDVAGASYSSYEDLYNTAGTKVAEAQDMTNGSGTLILSANGLTISSGSGQQSVTAGADLFAIDPHSVEAITASGRNSETFEYASGFGQSTVTGFLATGSAVDVVQFNLSMFNYLTPSMTQTQDVSALLAHATQAGANVEITDSLGDFLVLNGVTKTTLVANPHDFKFV